MRDEGLYLQDIVEAADHIAGFVLDVEKPQFLNNEMMRSAVLQKLMVIGEAAAKISEAVRDQHPEVPWADIVGFRNIAAHAYFAVNWNIVWSAATVDVPTLREKVSDILFWEFPSGDTD
jgi:uncharacterized protein with HEPN domain